MVKIKHILLFIFPIIGLVLEAQNFRFYANGVDTTYIGENYKVVFVIENAKQASNFTPPKFNGFKVVSEQQGSSTINNNGKISQSIYLTYFLQAEKEGKISIGAASAQINGNVEQTNAFSVFVKPARQKPATNPQANADDVLSQKDYSKDIFISLITNKSHPYVGEQITVSAKLYFNVSIYDFQPERFPEFNGFWSSELKTKQDEKTIETVNGKKYYVVEIFKYSLIPLKAGKLNINPLQYRSIIQAEVIRSHPFWGKYRDYIPQEYTVYSNSLNITAKALPLEGQPDNFNGAVGRFELITNVDSTTLNYGNPIQLEAKISGTGNLMMIDFPKLHFPENFDVYDPELDEKVLTNENRINGYKNYHYILVPQEPGNYKFSPVSFSYFDLNTKNYKTLYADTLSFNIEGELPKALLTENKEDSVPFNEIYPITTNIALSKAKNTFYGSAKYYTALVSPLFLFAFIFLAKRIKENSLVDTVVLKRKRASKEAQKRLKKAKEFLKQKNKEAFYTEIFDALNGYVSDKLNIIQADLNKELVVEKFNQKNVSEYLSSQFIQVLSNAEAALYAPTSVSKMQEDYEIVINWIVEIEYEIV